ncbi:MAG: hypothetical protein AAGD05_18565, partial [Bacteroidota bacterium]
VQFFTAFALAPKEKQVNLLHSFEAQLSNFLKDGVYNLAREFLLDDWIQARSNGQSYASKCLAGVKMS